MRKGILLIIATLLLTACQSTRGEIHYVDLSESLVVSESENDKIFNLNRELEYSYTTYDDYYAGFSFPYPSDWQLTFYSPNFITLRKDNAQISISHNLETNTYEGYKDFVDSFQDIWQNENLYLGGGRYFRRSGQTVTSKSVIAQNLIREDYDNIKLSNDLAEYVSHVYSERRYYFKNDNIKTMVSVVSDNLSDLTIADDIVSNLRKVSIQYDSTKLVEGLRLPESFEEIAGDGYKVYAPRGSDAFSGCFVQVVNESFKLTDKRFDWVMANAFDLTFNNVYSNSEELVMADEGIGIDVIVETEAKNAAVRPGNNYKLEIAQTDGKTIIIGYPAAKVELMREIKNKA